MSGPMTRERLDEIRVLCGVCSGHPETNAFGECLRDLLAEVERLEAEVKAAHRYAEEQIAANSRTLDEIVEILRPGETLDDAGIIEAVRALVERR